jgi:predicted RNA binding protein with dsRBD fold (UPF0201 family)
VTGNIANIGDVVKPAEILINRIADATGVLFKPHQMIREAKAQTKITVLQAEAEAKAALIRTQSDIESQAIRDRAAQRIVHEAILEQNNIENITEKALLLVDTAKITEESLTDNAWLTHFYDHAKTINDEYMQMFWAKILEEEAIEAKSFSRKAINILHEMCKEDVIDFQHLCYFMFSDILFIYHINTDFLELHNLSFNKLVNLETLGLIKLDNINGFSTIFDDQKINLKCSKKNYMTLNLGESKTMSVGKVILTEAGHSLSKIETRFPSSLIKSICLGQWQKLGYNPKPFFNV